MNRMSCILLALIWTGVAPAWAAEPPRSDSPGVGKLPHVEFDAARKQVRVECEMLAVDAPLEFFCCAKGTNDYEAMIRSEVKPSNLHLALLAIGLKPGQPLQYSEAAKRWIPPQGPPLQIMMEYQKEGKTLSVPAWKWMRDVKTKKPAPPFTWVFTGSRVMPDGKYAADVTGYLVSIVNFDLTVIDIPQLASSSNDLLEWERNPDTTPKAGSPVTMVIEPAGADHGNAAAEVAAAPSTQPAHTAPAVSAQPVNVEGEIHAAEQTAAAERKAWQNDVAKHRDALREAAESHYRIMQALRSQQQKLIDEADRMQQTIDELEKEYQDLTTPRPETK
jgi:hypothetical protein